jgi:dihydropteroate synthase
MVKDTFFTKKRFINCGGSYLDLSTPRIMGILNITPDSFYDGGKYQTPDAVLAQVRKMITEGADIIDIGAYSSRPGAKNISEKQELHRLSAVLEPIRMNFPDQLLSVDTFRSAIARKIIEDYQIDMINDISGGDLDSNMYEVIADFQVPYVLMHMQGNPQNMQQRVNYDDLLNDIITSLGEKIAQLRQRGVRDIVIDPGIGFGKTLDQNFLLMGNLHQFKILNEPLLIGVSRKSLIYKHLNISPDEALNGTTAMHMLALTQGADLLRVHDVKEAKQTVELYLKSREEVIKYTDQNR